MKPVVLLSAAALSCAAGVLHAQTYPTKPVRMVVPFAPSGPTDLLARLLGQKLTALLGQQVIVDNRGGAGGTIGSEAVARSAPDGYTMLLGHIGIFAVNPTLYPALKYDVVKDFAPVSLVADIPYAMVVHPALPARNVAELVALAKARPKQLLYGSGGTGGASHLAGAYFGLLAKVDITHVAYKGAGPALVDLLAGQTSMMITGLTPLVPHINAGKLRVLAVGSAKRLAIMPDVPTVGETVKGFQATQWYGVAVPAQTPRETVAALNSALHKALSGADVKERLAAGGADPLTSTPEAFGAYIRSEIARWAPVVKAVGAQAQ
ncbi:MAG TPA: tripartite tricarboxylate transporter substrate binding protein [Burkholderiales bacterium]|nr:tripartite tricarboxylate transporter substrate binding protein [Burkholderiales bacterium]